MTVIPCNSLRGRERAGSLFINCHIIYLGHQGPLLNHISSLLCTYSIFCNKLKAVKPIRCQAPCKSEFSLYDGRFGLEEAIYSVHVCGDNVIN